MKPLAGGPARVLVDLAGTDVFPAWSPDGRWIAWSNRPPGSATGVIYLAARDGTGVREVGRSYSGFPGAPLWAPDSRAVFFEAPFSSSYVPRGFPIVENGVFRATIDGGGSLLLRDHVSRLVARRKARPRRRLWTHRVRRLLPPGVFVMEADGSCLTFLTSGTSVDWQSLPGASPSVPAQCVDLVLTAAVVPPVGLRGVPYSVVLRNAGVVPATGVRLVQRFEAPVRVLLSGSSRRYCSTHGATVTCEIGVLSPRHQLTLATVARPSAGGVISDDPERLER